MIPVVFSRKAEDDLEAIADYIAQDNPARTLSFLPELRKQWVNLGHFPNDHPRFLELGERSRVIPYKNYVVLYQILDDTVAIERIIQGARDILNLIRDE